jgi:hypothetical protein
MRMGVVVKISINIKTSLRTGELNCSHFLSCSERSFGNQGCQTI